MIRRHSTESAKTQVTTELPVTYYLLQSYSLCISGVCWVCPSFNSFGPGRVGPKKISGEWSGVEEVVKVKVGNVNGNLEMEIKGCHGVTGHPVESNCFFQLPISSHHQTESRLQNWHWLTQLTTSTQTQTDLAHWHTGSRKCSIISSYRLSPYRRRIPEITLFTNKKIHPIVSVRPWSPKGPKSEAKRSITTDNQTIVTIIK